MEDRQPESGDSPAPETEQSTALVVVDSEYNQLEMSTSRSQPGFLQRLIYLLRPQSGSMRENVQDALALHSATDQTISPEERAMLHNILLLQGMRVDDVMVPRAEIEAVEQKTSIGELLHLFDTSGHSRMPIYSETLDDPRGMVHIRDLVSYLLKASAKKRRGRKSSKGTKSSVLTAAAMARNAAKTIASIDLSLVDLTKTIEELKLMREVLFVPPSMLASDLMGRMQTQRIQMALVIDEYGGTDGLVSLEDIVEVVVGNIEDEHDDVEVRIEPVSDGVYLMDARVELEEAAGYLGSSFLIAAQEEDDEVDTIGGLIFALLGRVPVRGEVISNFANHELEVMEADPRRIRRVKISRSRQAQKRRLSRREAAQAAKHEAAES